MTHHSLHLFRVLLSSSKRCVGHPCLASGLDIWYTATRYEHNASAKRKINTHESDKLDTVKNKQSTVQSAKMFTDLLSSINSFEGVLDVAYKSKNPDDVSLVLHRLGELCSKDPHPSEDEVYNVLNSERFEKLGTILNREALNLSSHLLLSSLGCLLTLAPEDVHIIKSLETQVLWMMKKWPVNHVYQILQIHEGRCTTDLRRQVYKAAMITLEQRWVEIRSPNVIVALFYKADPDSKLMSRLEDKALELADQLNTKELYRVFYILGKNRKRNSPLLFALAYHLNRQAWKFSPVHLCNLAYACARLSFYDTKLLLYISNEILQSIHNPELMKLIPSVLHSLSSLRWLHKILLDSLTEKLLQNVPDVSDYGLYSTLLTCAQLNYIPAAVSTVWSQLVSGLRRNYSDDPLRWLEIVWCIAVLGKLDSSLATSVLSPEFQDRLKGLSDSQMSLANLRLLNIQYSALHEVEDFDSNKLVSPPSHLSVVSGSRMFFSAVKEAISNLAPTEKYKKLDVVTPAGHVADMVLTVNSKGELQPVEDFAEPWLTAGTRELPEGWHRVALQVLEYQDMTLYHTQPTGLQEMVARHLRILGFKVVQVPYTAFAMDDTVVKKVQYLQNKIKVAIGAQTT